MRICFGTEWSRFSGLSCHLNYDMSSVGPTCASFRVIMPSQTHFKIDLEFKIITNKKSEINDKIKKFILIKYKNI